MQPLTGMTRYVFFGFFLSHIPITLVVDAQVLLGPYYPQALQDLLQFYIDTFSDPVMKLQPIWFTSLVSLELLLEVPYFFAATHYLYHYDSDRPYPEGFRYASIAYGAHTCTNLVPILATILFDDEHNLQLTQKLILAGFYLPYFVFPLGILLFAVFGDGFTNNKAKLY